MFSSVGASATVSPPCSGPGLSALKPVTLFNSPPNPILVALPAPGRFLILAVGELAAVVAVDAAGSEPGPAVAAVVAVVELSTGSLANSASASRKELTRTPRLAKVSARAAAAASTSLAAASEAC
jgi:hypothetical protein